MSGFFAVSVHLTFTHGDMPGGRLSERALGDLGVSLWLNAYEMGNDAGVHGVVTENVEGDEDVFVTRRFHPEAVELERLVRALEDAGFGARTPEVHDIGDTSEAWCRLLLHVSLNDKSGYLDLGLQGSGYDGADAEPLSTAIGLLLTMGRVAYAPAWFHLVRTAGDSGSAADTVPD